MNGVSTKNIGVIGILGLYEYDYDYLGCGVSTSKEFCDYRTNARCAEKQFLRNGWYFWLTQAKACGCPVNGGNIQENMLQTEKELKAL
jgi:hypothetical protein